VYVSSGFVFLSGFDVVSLDGARVWFVCYRNEIEPTACNVIVCSEAAGIAFPAADFELRNSLKSYFLGVRRAVTITFKSSSVILGAAFFIMVTNHSISSGAAGYPIFPPAAPVPEGRSEFAINVP